MGLKGTIGKAVTSAFKALGSSGADGVNQPITYRSMTTTAAFNASTGAVVDAAYTTLTFDGIVYDVDIREVDNTKIKVGDRRVIFPTSSVPTNFSPKLTDNVLVDGTLTTVKDFSQDPAKATWIILIRNP
jgi:hypothetical protein